MRHRVHKKNFGRNTNQRKALFRNLMINLFMHERIETTVTKAKVIKSLAEKVVTLGKKGDLHSKRTALSYVPNRAAIAKLFSEIAPRFSKRNGGYLRVVKTRTRLKDQASLAVLEFVDYEESRVAQKTTKEGKKS
ncbi:MAG TPA: 50S ribosomal protein L17 [Nitrospirae bacterium]|jgi:large subunit ribosomal protein L17|nr:50S ribosomal protein L17 [Nitrospirota bacterium]